MSSDAAHTRWWQIAEVVFGLPFLAALALQRAVPLALPRGIWVPVRVSAGAAFLVAGVVIVVLARREFARWRQPTDPGQPTASIVTSAAAHRPANNDGG